MFNLNDTEAVLGERKEEKIAKSIYLDGPD